jgi:uncharacterized membrane protein
MTLLVVELTVPEIASGAPIDVGPRLWALGPRYFSYAVSFLVIASYWRAHQRIFSYVVRSDEGLVWINVLLLLCIAFQPFPTSVLGRYGDQPAAVTLYAGTLATTGVIVLVLWIYATSGRRLVRPDIDRRVVTPPHVACRQRPDCVSGLDRRRAGESVRGRVFVVRHRGRLTDPALGVPRRALIS